MASFDFELLQKAANEIEDDFTEDRVDGFWDGVIAVARLSGDTEMLQFALERSDRLTP